MRIRLFFICLLAFLAFAPRSTGANDGFVGIDERLGGFVPKDARLRGEAGEGVELGTLIKRPTILSLAYFGCTNLCTDVLSGIADTIKAIEAEPGKDYSVLTISFDASDNYERASSKKRDYLSAAGRPVPQDAWRFLTGDSSEVAKIAGAVGFSFLRQGDGFRHPAAIIVLSEEGRIIRYLYGTKFLPRDVELALMEAASNRPGPTIPKPLLFCFRYDPENKVYVLDVLKLSGMFILASAAAFLIYAARVRTKGGDNL